jgi:hypothetical protein
VDANDLSAEALARLEAWAAARPPAPVGTDDLAALAAIVAAEARRAVEEVCWKNRRTCGRPCGGGR